MRTVAFERLVQELAEDHQLFVMDRKGTSIREQAFDPNPCFLLTDHIPMPKNTFHSLERLGTKKISLGSKMLFASQCVVLIHHELDQAGDNAVHRVGGGLRIERNPAVGHRGEQDRSLGRAARSEFDKARWNEVRDRLGESVARLKEAEFAEKELELARKKFKQPTIEALVAER